MDPKVSGRGADAKFRHAGKVVSKEVFDAAVVAQAKTKQRQPKFLEEEVPWAGGLAQRRAAEEGHEAMAREVCCCGALFWVSVLHLLFLNRAIVHDSLHSLKAA
jgi:hypothetical protein